MPVITIASSVSYFYPTARAEFDASASGNVVYRTSTGSTRTTMLDRTGTELRIIEDKDDVYDHSISPDGKKAAVSVTAPGTGLMDIRRLRWDEAAAAAIDEGLLAKLPPLSHPREPLGPAKASWASRFLTSCSLRLSSITLSYWGLQ